MTLAAHDLPTVDISQQTWRHSIVAQGTEEVYQGHPTTVRLPGSDTILAVWCINHGGFSGPLKRSDDGGRTWSDLLPVPPSWHTAKNCPAIYRLTDPQGVSRLFVFAAKGPDGNMCGSYSEDEGRTWTQMQSTGLSCVMPFCAIVPIHDGRQLLGQTNSRRPWAGQGESETKTNVITQSLSSDGGKTWSPWEVVVDLPGLSPCEPCIIRSDDGRQLMSILRENSRTTGGLYVTSDDEGRTWSPAKRIIPGLHGDRHMHQRLPDGRRVIVFRDVGLDKAHPTYGHFVAWVGTYDDIIQGRPGQCRIKLLHSHARWDCGYPGLELLDDGTLVATTYIKYDDSPRKHSVVATRFKVDEIEEMLRQARA